MSFCASREPSLAGSTNWSLELREETPLPVRLDGKEAACLFDCDWISMMSMSIAGFYFARRVKLDDDVPEAIKQIERSSD